MFINFIDGTAFSFFGIEIKWYAILIVSGIVLAVWLSNRESLRVGFMKDDIIDFVVLGLPVSIVGARLYYVLFDLQDYLENPIQVFNIRNGGLAVYGGLIAGGITLYFYSRHCFISPWLFLDVAAPSVLIAQAIGRWGNFTNHEAYGPVTTKSFLEALHLPKFIIQNMYIDGQYRQPTFLYESIWCVIGFILILVIRNKTNFYREGEIFLSYLLWYSFGRFFIEGLRTDSLYLFGHLRISQALSAGLFLASIILFIYRRKRVQPPVYTRKVGNSIDKN